MIHEVVVHAVDFTWTHGAGGVRHRHANVRLAVDQRVHQATFAGARGGGNDVQRAAGDAHGSVLKRLESGRRVGATIWLLF